MCDNIVKDLDPFVWDLHISKAFKSNVSIICGDASNPAELNKHYVFIVGHCELLQGGIPFSAHTWLSSVVNFIWTTINWYAIEM